MVKTKIKTMIQAKDEAPQDHQAQMTVQVHVHVPSASSNPDLRAHVGLFVLGGADAADDGPPPSSLTKHLLLLYQFVLLVLQHTDEDVTALRVHFYPLASRL